MSDGLLQPGQHMGKAGDADKAHQAINARFAGVIFHRLGPIQTQITKGDGINKGASAGRAEYVAYAALIDRHTATQVLAMAFCSQINGSKLVIPAITLDRLPWMQLHVRTYTDTEFGDLTNQLPLAWDNLGAPQQLTIDAYDKLEETRLHRDKIDSRSPWTRDSNVCTYRTRDGTLAIAVRPQRDGTVGNDMPKESTFSPVFELFDCVVWFALESLAVLQTTLVASSVLYTAIHCSKLH